MKNKLSKILIGMFLGFSLLATSGIASAWYKGMYYYYQNCYTTDCYGCCKNIRCKTIGYYDQCGYWVTVRNVCWYR